MNQFRRKSQVAKKSLAHHQNIIAAHPTYSVDCDSEIAGVSSTKIATQDGGMSVNGSAPEIGTGNTVSAIGFETSN